MTTVGNGADRDQLVAVALGEQPAELVILGGQLVNVYSGEIYRADVAIHGERIAAVGDVERCIGPQTKQVDAGGRYLLPGFIETHIHVGASSLTMTELARLLVPLGTAVIVTDFTEAGKMRGKGAMRFFLDETKRTPLRAYFSPFYTTLLGIEGRPGVSLEDLEEMLGWEECVELREWNLYAQRHADERLRSLADLARAHGKLVCGHLEGQSGGTLQASAAAGALSDHEAATEEEALERLRLGLALQVRFSSGADNLGVLRALARVPVDTRNVMFATDEEDIDDIARLGHIDHRIRAAVEMGISPLDAIRMATINAASYLRKTGDVGGIAPGRLAFVNLVDDLRDLRVREVVHGAEVVARDGRYVGRLEAPEYPESFRDTIKLRSELQASDFEVRPDQADAATSGNTSDVLVIDIAPYDVVTRAARASLPVVDGAVRPSVELGVATIAVVERHFASGKIGLGFIRGFGLQRGAFGSSYHPGPVHLGIVGVDEADMALVGNRIAELGGGFVAATDGQVVAEVPLPLLGFLSEQPAEEVVAAFREAKRAVKEELGADFDGLFTALAYACMPGVLPEVRMTVDGPVSVERDEQSMNVRKVGLWQASQASA